MSDYIKLFNTEQDQTTFRNGSSYVQPHVSCVAGGKNLLYNKFNTNGHDYVDLGLPSGTLWATCNIGANSPEEYGDYFTWGGTSPYGLEEKYPYFDDDWNYIKYCTNDGLKELELTDDVARVVMGGRWSMPTPLEVYELIDNTTSSWETLNMVYGKRFTGSNGNSIFIPAAGIYDDSDSLQYDSDYCYLWTSGRDDYEEYGCSFLCSATSAYTWTNHRWNSMSVRGVIVPEQNTISEQL